MRIQCKLKRPNGTQVQLGSELYDFQPDQYGRHVCEVKNRAHVDRLLMIPEAYRPCTDEDPEVLGELPDDFDTLTPAVPEGTEDDDDDQGPGDEPVADVAGLEPAVPEHGEAPDPDEPKPEHEPNTPWEPEPEPKDEDEDEDEDAPQEGKTLEEMTDEELAVVHEQVVGRKPNGKAKRATIIANIEKADS